MAEKPRPVEEEIAERRAARARLAASGRPPYPPRATRTHRIAAAREALGEVVSICGRIRARRGHGKMVFLDLEDESGRMQVQFRKDLLGDEAFAAAKELSLGDFLGVEGEVFETKTGEVTVAGATWTLLAKALRPIPKYHGIEDPETRYRKRYLELATEPELRARFAARSRMVSALRRFFEAEGFLEVETPMLHPIPGGALARPFATHHNALDVPLYLRVAPELYLKRLLVGGFERVFELGKSFRNEGIDRMHNPEFTMCEAYAAYGDYRVMMDLFERAVAAAAEAVSGTTRLTIPEGFLGAGTEVDLSPPWKRVPYLEAIEAGGGPKFEGTEEAGTIEEAFEKHAAPNLVEPTIVVDFPVSISPLAKSRPDAPHLAERFEPFVGGVELGNAFSELNDPDEQRKRFEAAIEGGRVHQVLDEDFLEALETGMPPAGGLGIGIDRLAMLLLGTGSIREVIFFPTLRPK